MTRAPAVTLAYLLLATWTTWPLARELPDHVVDTVARQGPFGWLTLADIYLVIWALAWDVHALVTAPLSLFDANVFHPARWALARADHFLGNLPLFAPFYLVSDNPVLAHQAVLLLTFVLSALTMFLAVRAWTGSPGAGFAAGLMFGFAPWRMAQLAHVQMLSAIYLPLVLLAAAALVRKGRTGAWWGLTICVLLQALCSVYLGLAALVAAGAMTAGTWYEAPRNAWRRATAAVGSLGVAAVLTLAVSWRYVALHRAGAIPRVSETGTRGMPLELVAANPFGTYFLPHDPTSPDGYYFIGWTCCALALAGVFAARRTRHAETAAIARPMPPRGGLLLVLLAGWLLSLGYGYQLPGGTVLPLPLDWLARALPVMGSVRAPVRLGIVVALAMPALAGIGYALLERYLRGRAGRAALLVAVAAASLYETTPAAIPLRPVSAGTETSSLYRWLAAQPPGPVLELPVGFLDRDFRGDLQAIHQHSRYQYFSTQHWRPLLNGYSGHPPESFFFLMAIARRLPAADALQDLVDLAGVRWIVVHRSLLRGDERAAWDHAEERVNRTGLVPRATFGENLLFEVRLPARRDVSASLRTETPQLRTLNGLSRDPLPKAALHGTLTDLTVPAALLAGAVHHGRVSVRNLSDWPWPGFDPIRRGLVNVSYRWRRVDGSPKDGRQILRSVSTRVGRDLGPGESMRLPFAILAPPDPGRYELTVTLHQDGGPWFDKAGGVAARIMVNVRTWPSVKTGLQTGAASQR
jgi:hypothetical protein